MAKIAITQFGGISPSVDPRNLPADGAQIAQNVDLRYGDFRPSKAPGTAVATVPSDTRAIFRTPTGVWLSSTGDANFVNAQISDEGVERVYVTGNDSYPQAWQDGAYRRLGVPKPDTKASVVVDVVDEFTPEEAADSVQTSIEAIVAAIQGASSSSLLGLTPLPSADDRKSTFTDAGDDLSKWTLSTQVNGGYDRSLIMQVTTSGSPAPCYATVRDEGNDWARAYAYRDFGIASSVATDFACDVRFQHPGVNNSWYSRREAQVTVQGNSTGAGIRVALIDYDGMRGNPNAAYLSIDAATGWATGVNDRQTACLASVMLPGHLAQLTNYTISVSVVWTGDTTANVTARVLQGATVLATVSVSGATFGRGGYCAFHQYFGPDANGAVGGLPEGFVTYWDNFVIEATKSSGFWVPHGDALAGSAIPTVLEGDYALFVEMSSDLGSTDLLNSNQTYLKDGSLNGVQTTYDGTRYWAVPALKFKARGKMLDEDALRTALSALTLPSDTSITLLGATTVESIIAGAAAIFEGEVSPTASLLSNLRTAEAALVNLIDADADIAGSTGKTSNTLDALADLETASSALTNWWALTSDTYLESWVTSTFSATLQDGLPTQTTRIIDTRSYVVTYVTDWDEESAPCSPSELLEVDQNDSVSITAPVPPAGRHIVGWRLYRSATSSTGGAFQLVADEDASNAVLKDGVFWCFDIADLTYTDAKKQEELQELLPTLTWAEPPENLIGIVGLPNGMMAGFFGKTLCFSVPDAGYAWPIEYQHALEYDIVALRVFGQTVVVLSKGNPYFASGADSASISTQKIEAPQACIAPRTAVSIEGGVLYASPDGLCLASAQGVTLLTQGAFDRDDWNDAVGEDSFAAFHDGSYYLFASPP